MTEFKPLVEQHRLSRLRVRPPVPDQRSAIVLEGRGGHRLVTVEEPLHLLDFLGGRFQHLSRVDTTPHDLSAVYQVPSSELARPFQTNLQLTVKVVDAVKVVKEPVADAWAAIEPVVRLPLRQIGRRHNPDQLAQVEEKLHQYLTDLTVEEVGLRVVRAGVSVDLERSDLKREQEKIQDKHRRELDEEYAQHRVKLEKAEGIHQRELAKQHARHLRELETAREQHQRALERQRRQLYEEVLGEGLLPKLLLIKLGARPAGGDSKELNEVIDLVTQLRIDNFKVPLDLLANYTHVMERWQLEEPVNALLKHLVTTFGPQVLPPLPDEPEIQVTVGDPEPADTSASNGNSRTSADEGRKPPTEDQDQE
jgi:hypothetical protein